MHVLFLTDIGHDFSNDRVFGELQALSDQKSFPLTNVDFDRGYDWPFETEEPPEIVLIDLRNIVDTEVLEQALEKLVPKVPPFQTFVWGANPVQKKIVRAHKALPIENIDTFCTRLNLMDDEALTSQNDASPDPAP